MEGHHNVSHTEFGGVARNSLLEFIVVNLTEDFGSTKLQFIVFRKLFSEVVLEMTKQKNNLIHQYMELIRRLSSKHHHLAIKLQDLSASHFLFQLFHVQAKFGSEPQMDQSF